jgi:hypothetical protein
MFWGDGCDRKTAVLVAGFGLFVLFLEAAW